MTQQTYRFRPQQRLLTAGDFKSVFDQAQVRVSHQAYLILAKKRANADQPGRIGLVVSKKNLKRAVDRNRFKRVVRDSFRRNQHTLVGIELVVLARPGTRQHLDNRLATTVDKSWGRLLKKIASAGSERS